MIMFKLAQVHRGVRRHAMCGVLALVASGLAWAGSPQTGKLTKDQARDQAQRQASAERVSQHFPFGPVVPSRPLPAWAMVTHQGRTTDLATLCKGQLTAIQLVYTHCSAICPIQGALFAQAQKGVAARRLQRVQFLSLSVDPLSDTPQALSRWIRQFEPAAGWLAASPTVSDVRAMQTLLSKGGEAEGETIDAHPGQVYFINRKGALVYRSPSLPTASQIVEILEELDRHPD